MAAPDLYALLIAADQYLPNRLPEGSYPSLRGCVRDITLVENYLRSHLGLADSHLIKRTSTNTGAEEPPEPELQRPTYDNVVNAFRQLSIRARPGDHVYIHYSGHGGRVRPTLLPEVKGARAFDEALVPIDIANSSASYLRDLEIAWLLQDLEERQLVVTMVLDCCYSAGLTRGIDATERGVDFIDEKTLRRTESDVASIDQLRQAWLRLGGGATRSLAAPAVPPTYTLLAACRENEKANEFAFDGKERNGALTYWLIDALRSGGPSQTLKMIYDRVLAKVHTKFPTQTPVLLGDPGRLVFEDRTTWPTFTTLVLGVEPGGKRLTLATGLANAVTDGAEFAIYPRTASDLSDPRERKARVRLIDARDAESEAEVAEVFGKGPPEAGDQAVLLAAALTLRRRVKFIDHEGRAAPDSDPAFLAIRKAIPGNGWVESAESGRAADFAVRLSEARAGYEICSADGTLLPMPPLPVSAGPGVLLQRLVHLAKYRAWVELENKAPNATLQKSLEVELLGFPADFNPKQYPWPQPQPLISPIPTVTCGQWIALRLTNHSPRAVNITILDLQPDWGISVAYPPRNEGDFASLDSSSDGGEPLVVLMKAGLPPGFLEGQDILKVIAAHHPLGLRAAELPSLDLPLPTDRGGARSLSGDPLEQLVAALDAGRPKSRSVASYSLPGREWAAAQFAVRVELPS